MKQSLLHHIIQSLESAKKHNTSQTVAPQVILWPDPDRQWLSVVDTLREHIELFLTYGDYKPEILQGPAIWLKCMVDQSLPEANWDEETIPVIYLPGIAKDDFKKIEEASDALQPLMEYQFTGQLWTQENGREWSVLAFLQNKDHGLGLEVNRDGATREALIKALPRIIEDGEVVYRKKIDADYLNELLFPQVIPTLLDWVERGDQALATFSMDHQSSFREVVKSQYGVELNYSIVLDIVRKLGCQQPPWHPVWQYFANAPHKYPKILKYLRDAKPEDLGVGIFAIPASSWPQVNEEKERELIEAIVKWRRKDPAGIGNALKSLEKEHAPRLSWIWAELGQSNMALVLPELTKIAALTTKSFPAASVAEIVQYYTEEGFQIDAALRSIYSRDLGEEQLSAVQVVIDLCYKPWLERMTGKFQELIKADHRVLYSSYKDREYADFVLFVDAFRYDLAREFFEKNKNQFQMELGHSWAGVPSVTPTSKPSVSPIIGAINNQSEWSEFKAQLISGKTLSPYYFKAELSKVGYQAINGPSDIADPQQKYWMEIGDIDKRGHQEQASMLRRIPEMMEDLRRKIEAILKKGVKNIQIVTDHGWLLLPGNLPKESLHRNLAETRWGRCVLLKEGVNTDYLYLPWSWNPDILIAFAPGISFFKNNEAYAHGGISIHECLTPMLTISALAASTRSGKIEELTWRGMRLNIMTSGTDGDYQMDVRTKWDEASSTVAESVRMKDRDEWTLVVNGDYEGQAASLVLLNQEGIIIDKKLLQIGG